MSQNISQHDDIGAFGADIECYETHTHTIRHGSNIEAVGSSSRPPCKQCFGASCLGATAPSLVCVPLVGRAALRLCWATMTASDGNAAGSASTGDQGEGKEYQSLKELTHQSAAIGKWLLTVGETPRAWEYGFSLNGKQCKGKRFEVNMVSADAGVYCTGAFRRKTDNPAGNRKFDEALATFAYGSVWEASKIVLAKEKPCFISSPLKLMIDLSGSRMVPVLQKIYKMPSEATPLDTLHTILMCPPQQRVDITALLFQISPVREASTARGDRLIFDVTIRDDSGPERACEASFTVFLQKTESSRKRHAELEQTLANKKPVTFFALQCDMEEAKKIVKPDFERFRWAACKSGARGEELLSKAENILNPNGTVTVISQIPEFEPKEAEDYVTVPATHTTCELLNATIRSGVQLMEAQSTGEQDSERKPALFQINHARICEPSGRDNLLTNNGERLFPLVRIVDRTGALEMRMREKVALELSGESSKESFLSEFDKGALNFPILSSVRVIVKKTAGAGEHAEELSAYIVEAEPQRLEVEAAPNKSLKELHKLLKVLPTSTERMMVAPVGAIKHSPHGGMVVEVDGKIQQCSCVLTFFAHTGKSQVDHLANGHRIVSKDIWNIPFTGGGEEPESTAPEHADKKAPGDFASFCTMNNVQYYTLSPGVVKEPVYAIVVISNAVEHGNTTMYMIDKVAKIEDKNMRVDIIKHFRKLGWALGESREKDAKRTSRTFSPTSTDTPYTVRKARRLSLAPSDASIASLASSKKE